MIALIIFGGLFILGISFVIYKFFTQSKPSNEKTSMKEHAAMQTVGWGVLILITLVLMGAGLID